MVSPIQTVVGVVVLMLCAMLLITNDKLKSARLELAERDTQIERAASKAQEEARDSELKIAEARAEAGKQFEEGKKHAQEEYERVVAGLDSGAIKLRREWASCETGRLSENSSAERELGYSEQRRRESAGRIVRAADECDAQTAALIEDAKGVRATVNGK